MNQREKQEEATKVELWVWQNKTGSYRRLKGYHAVQFNFEQRVIYLRRSKD